MRKTCKGGTTACTALAGSLPGSLPAPWFRSPSRWKPFTLSCTRMRLIGSLSVRSIQTTGTTRVRDCGCHGGNVLEWRCSAVAAITWNVRNCSSPPARRAPRAGIRVGPGMGNRLAERGRVRFWQWRPGRLVRADQRDGHYTLTTGQGDSRMMA